MHKPLTRVTPGRKAAQRRGRSPARGRLAEPSRAREAAARPQVQNAWEPQPHGNDKAQLENQEAKSLAGQSRCRYRCRQWELGLPDFPSRMPPLDPRSGKHLGAHRASRTNPGSRTGQLRRPAVPRPSIPAGTRNTHPTLQAWGSCLAPPQEALAPMKAVLPFLGSWEMSWGLSRRWGLSLGHRLQASHSRHCCAPLGQLLLGRWAGRHKRPHFPWGPQGCLLTLVTLKSLHGSGAS